MTFCMKIEGIAPLQPFYGEPKFQSFPGIIMCLIF